MIYPLILQVASMDSTESTEERVSKNDIHQQR